MNNLEKIEIKNVGEFYFAYLKDEVEKKAAGEFLQNFIIKFARQDKNFYDKYKMHSFTKSETNCYGYINEILSDKAFLREFEIKRIGKERGRLDYLIHSDDYAFAIELKHMHKGYEGSKIILEKQSYKKTFKVKDQIKRMRIEYIPEICNDVKGIIPIALTFITFYASSKDKNKIKDKIEKLDIVKRIIMQNMDLINSKDFNFQSIWFLDKNVMQGPHYKISGRFAIYPSLCSVANIYPKYSK